MVTVSDNSIHYFTLFVLPALLAGLELRRFSDNWTLFLEEISFVLCAVFAARLLIACFIFGPNLVVTVPPHDGFINYNITQTPIYKLLPTIRAILVTFTFRFIELARCTLGVTLIYRSVAYQKEQSSQPTIVSVLSPEMMPISEILLAFVCVSAAVDVAFVISNKTFGDLNASADSKASLGRLIVHLARYSWIPVLLLFDFAQLDLPSPLFSGLKENVLEKGKVVLPASLVLSIGNLLFELHQQRRTSHVVKTQRKYPKALKERIARSNSNIEKPKPRLKKSYSASDLNISPNENAKLFFLMNWIKNPLTTGAVFPSSRYLAAEIVSEIDIEARNKTIVELGPGTGSFTSFILNCKHETSKYHAFELNEEFNTALKAKFEDFSNNFHCSSAENMLHVLKLQDANIVKAKVDIVISGLPFSVFPEDLQVRIMDQVKLSLKEEGGVFVTFAYISGMVLPKARFFKKLLKKKFRKVERSRIVWRNFPPAFVYRCQT